MTTSAARTVHFRARAGVPLVLLTLLQACASIPPSHTLVPSAGTDKALQSLSLKSGAVADALTIGGEEHYILISPSADQTLTGRAMNPITGEVCGPFRSWTGKSPVEYRRKAIAQP